MNGIRPHTAAHLLGVSTRTIERWARLKKIGSVNFGERMTRVCRGCIELIQRRGQGAQAQCACWGEGDATEGTESGEKIDRR